MYRMRNKIIISLVAILFICSALSVSAQARTTDLILSLSPKYPMPNQSVTATLSSFAIDLNKANISWSVSGTESAVGIGKKTFSFDMGNVGEPLSIQARIDTVDGQSLVKNILATPAEVDMLWEGDDSYAPPFYKGRTLVTGEGTFKVVAIPNITTSYGHLNPNNVSYTWVKDANNQPSVSGWGKNYFIFKNSYLDKDNVIEVTASDISGNTSAGGRITLQTVAPEILFYENNPKLGTNYATAITNGFTINNIGESFAVEPYFFSSKNIDNGDLAFDWSINDIPTQTPSPINILSIKPNSGESGIAKIAVAITNTKSLFQTLTKELRINF